MVVRRRWLALMFVMSAMCLFLGTAALVLSKHGAAVQKYTHHLTNKETAAKEETRPLVKEPPLREQDEGQRAATRKAPPLPKVQLTEEQQRKRQEKLDKELSKVEARLDAIGFALYPHPENGTCSGEINIITQVPVLPEVLPEVREVKTDQDAAAIEKDRKYAQEKGPLHRRRRQEEYLDTLRKNLRNPHVKRIHVLVERASDMDFILDHGMPDECGKLHPVVLGRWMHYRDAFEYASTHLHDELCVIMNADIYLAQGWQFATKALFERKPSPHVYVLSRWEGPSVFCVEKEEASCQKRAKVGSYDAFFFRSPLPLDESSYKQLDYQQNIWGAENRALGVLRARRIDVTNPCKILQVGHNHCDSFFRPQQGMHEGQYRVPGSKGGVSRYAVTL